MTGYLSVSWAADLGPYTGPTPPLPPAVVLPPGADELDYYVGIPHPDGLLEDFNDGSYDAGNYYDVYTYTVSGVQTSSSFGSDGLTGVLTPEAHIFITWFVFGGSQPGPRPSQLPLELVPPEYVGIAGPPLPPVFIGGSKNSRISFRGYA
jgi:hypothetical protein